MTVPAFKSWSQSRLNDYDQCPLMAKLKHLDKLCPRCFNGKVKGGYGTPAICDTCKAVIKKGDALERGSAVGLTLEHFVKGTRPDLHRDITHPKVIALAASLREEYTKKRVLVERSWNFDRDWKPLPPHWSPSVWLIVKTDVFHIPDKTTGRVIDWKTGGVDKRNGNKPYASDKYGEQLRIYSTAALCAMPALEKTTSALCFVDAGLAHKPIIEKKSGKLARKDLAKNIEVLTKRALPMFKDDQFAPRANDKCKWCDFSKDKGGPCPY